MSFDKFLTSLRVQEETKNDLIFCELTDYFGYEDDFRYFNRNLINIIHDYCVVEFISKDEEILEIIKNSFEYVLNSEINEYKLKADDYKAKYLVCYRAWNRDTERKGSRKRSKKGSNKCNSSSRKGSAKNKIFKKIKIRKLY